MSMREISLQDEETAVRIVPQVRELIFVAIRTESRNGKNSTTNTKGYSSIKDRDGILRRPDGIVVDTNRPIIQGGGREIRDPRDHDGLVDRLVEVFEVDAGTQRLAEVFLSR